MNATTEPTTDNDDWSAQSKIWGEAFCLTVRTTGTESVGQVPHTRVYHALENYLLMEEHSLEAGDRPDDPDDLPQLPKKSRRFTADGTIVTVWLAATSDVLEDEFGEVASLARDAVPDDWQVMG